MVYCFLQLKQGTYLIWLNHYIKITTDKEWWEMRNKSLDAAKAVAACLVVFIHVSFPGQVGQIIKVLDFAYFKTFFHIAFVLSCLGIYYEVSVWGRYRRMAERTYGQ